jgi:Transposase domain (DUF772)
MLWQGGAHGGQPGFFDVDERYAALSSAGDPLARLALVVEFELFRADLAAALERSDRARGGRPPYDPVLMFKVLVLQTLYTLSDEQTEYQIRDRLSFMRFVGLALEDRVPDGKTIWLFREQLTKAGAVERLFARSIASCARPVISPWAGRSSMPPSLRRAGLGSRGVRRQRSKVVACPRAGRRRSARRWIPRAAGRSSGAAGDRLTEAGFRNGPRPSS